MIAAKQIIFQVIAFLSFSFVALATAPAGETVTLTPSGDTTVRGGSYENDNLSTSGTFGTKQSKTPLNTREGLVKFTLTDLYATGGVVSSAILTLQVRSNNNDAGTAEIAVSSILDDEWEDNVVTFATKPTYASTPIETKFAPPKGDEMTFDLTDAITTAWSFGSKTVSFAFTGLTTSAVSFASIDDTKGREPQLVVTFAEPDPVCEEIETLTCFFLCQELEDESCLDAGSSPLSIPCKLFFLGADVKEC